MAAITEEEHVALKEFKHRIGDVMGKMQKYHQKDLCLMRWLRARDLDVQKAEEMLRKNLQWRDELKIDSILSKWQPDNFLVNNLPAKISGVDKEGCVICIQPYGRWDLRHVVEEGYGSDYVKYMVQLLEQGYALMEKDSAGRKQPLTQIVLVYDLEGLSMRQIVSREKIIQADIALLKTFESNYPETLKYCYILNAPKMFELLFNLLKPILTGNTLSKVRVFGSNSKEWKQALFDHIEPDELPSDYGGTNTSVPNYTMEMGLNWIPRAILFPESAFKKVALPAGQAICMEVTVDEPNTQLTWNFKTEGYNIGFQLKHDGEDIYDNKRTDSHVRTQKGTHCCAQPGVYTMCFDNTFSKFRSKTLYYAYSTAADGSNCIMPAKQ